MDVQKFRTSVFPLKDKLYRFAFQFLSQTEEAEDIVQETFIRLWKKRTELGEYRSLEALAMVITRNLCLDKLRIRRFPVENFEDHRAFLENLPMKASEADSEMILNVHEAIRKLPENQRTIIHLRDVEGYEFDEIAGIVGMTENAIRVALSRARKRIREMVTNQNTYGYQGN